MEHEVIGGLSGGNGIQRNDARGDDFGIVHVSLRTPFFVGLRFFLQLGRIYESVAPETTRFWCDWSRNGVYIAHNTSIVAYDLGTNLDTWNQVLMDDGVEQQTRSHSVRRKEDVIAVRQVIGYVRFHEIHRERLYGRIGVGPLDIALGEMDLAPCQ